MTTSTNINTFVRARIDSDTKDKANQTLRSLGLTSSDAIRILLRRIATDKTFPLELKIPNAKTREAIEEIESGKGKTFSNIEDLMADLNA